MDAAEPLASASDSAHGSPTDAAKAALYTEVSRRAREQGWHTHVPANRFLERQHRMLRTALGVTAANLLLVIPAAYMLALGGNNRLAEDSGVDILLGVAYIAAAGACVLLVIASTYVSYRVFRSFRAYGRAPLERCPALIVGKRSVPRSKPGGKDTDFVTLEFGGGERREYRAARATFELACEQRAGLAYLRANHLLHLELIPA